MENMALVAAAWLAAALLTAYVVWFLRLAQEMTGPRVWPVLGSLPGLACNASRIHDWIAENLRECGGTYRTCTCAVPGRARRQGLTVVTCDPRNMEHVLRSRFRCYPKGPAWQDAFRDLLGHGIFNTDNESWQKQRKTAALGFTGKSLRLAMERWMSRSVHGRLLPILLRAAEDGSSVDLQDALLRLTFDNICGVVLGKDPQTLHMSSNGINDKSSAFAADFDSATEASLHRLLVPGFVWKIKRWLRLGAEAGLQNSVRHIQEHIASMIQTRKMDLFQQQQHDLLSRFVDKDAYPDDFLRDVAINFILAGRDTTAVALCWFFWLLTAHPAVEDKIVEEVFTVLKEIRSPTSNVDNDEADIRILAAPLTYDEARRLVYLKAVLSETLRLYPSVPEDSKYAAEDDVLPDGTFVPAGATVSYSIYAAGRSSKLWGDDCMEFRPERWLSPDGKTYVEPKDPFQFVVFNAGPRVCLGKDLAYLQMKAVVAAVLLRFRFQLVPGHPVEQKMSLTLFMKHGLRVNVHSRDLSAIAAKVASGGR